MLVQKLKSKIHRATVTHADPDYTGSIEIDEALMDAAGIAEFEKVLVADISNGNRFETYAIKGKRGSGVVGINGAAAKLADVGDLVIVMSFALAEPGEKTNPKIILVDGKNRIAEMPEE